MVYHIKPDLVAGDKLQPAELNQPLIPRLAQSGVEWVRPWHVLMSGSYVGNPERASADKGRQFLDACAGGMARFLVDLSREPWHEKFPYPAE